jgi:hypothetical protein
MPSLYYYHLYQENQISLEIQGPGRPYYLGQTIAASSPAQAVSTPLPGLSSMFFPFHYFLFIFALFCSHDSISVDVR